MAPGALEQRLGHEFVRPELLRRALSHRSWVAESGEEHSNERLEFLGDAVLGWVIADLAYARYADLAEGALTDLRKSVVNARALAEVAEGLDLGAHLLLGRGEDAAGGRRKVSILSDAMEAVLGAVYLDGGSEAAFELVQRLFTPMLDVAVDSLDTLDYKSALQERLAQTGRPTPEYRIRSTGPDHDKRFFASVLVADELLGEGEGPSKKAAEQAAASMAFAALAAQAELSG
ncbi:ribonuclease III [Ilumatobacter sp.]|uniref:ribonuclease III n=1 Tax=Ilumatobacter sp. TaxID=1967498 RepID=UPI003AF9219B